MVSQQASDPPYKIGPLQVTSRVISYNSTYIVKQPQLPIYFFGHL